MKFESETILSIAMLGSYSLKPPSRLYILAAAVTLYLYSNIKKRVSRNYITL